MNVWQTSAPTGRMAGLWGWMKKALPIVAVLFFASLMGAATGLGLGILIALLVVMVAVGALMLWDYRVGVVALILIMPVSNTYLFPRQLFGITGFSPENLILLGTAGVYFIKHLFSPDGPLRVSSKFLWFYILPLMLAGVWGSFHVDRIFPGYFIDDKVKYSTAVPYFRDVVIKPLFFLLYGYLVAAAAKGSKRPLLFLVPFVGSMLLMVLVVFYGALNSGLGLDGLADSTNRQALAVVGMHANELGPMLVTGIVFVLFVQAVFDNAWARFACWFVMAVAVVAVISLVAMLIPQEVIDRATEGMQPGATDVQSMAKDDKLTAGRVTGIWVPVLSDVVQSPVVGRGLMSMLWSTASWSGATPHLMIHPHNAYLRLLMDMGVIGMALVLSGVYFLWKHFRRLSARDDVPSWVSAGARGCSLILVVYSVFAVTGGSWMPGSMQVLAWGAFGLVLGSVKVIPARHKN